MRLVYLIILFFNIFPIFSQKSSLAEVDSLLKESHQKFAELKFVESSKIADQALDLSVVNNYSKGIVMSKLYIAKVLLEIGLNREAIEYLEAIDEEAYFKKEAIPQVESHRLKGRIYGNQQLYTLAKEEFIKQLLLSENIADPKKKELSKLWAYQNIEHLYLLQENIDSIEVYQNLQEKQLLHCEEQDAFFNISSLHTSRGRLYLNKGKYDAAAVEIQKSVDMLEKYSTPYKYVNLQILGDLEVAKGNTDNAISYYNNALENSVFLKATYASRDLHKKLADYLLNHDTLIDKAREHAREHDILNDSLKNHNSMVVNSVLGNIKKKKEELAANKVKIFWCVVVVITLISILLGLFMIVRSRIYKLRLLRKNRKLFSTTKRIELLEEKLENNILNDIIELAKSNSPEFLTLFSEGYPEFIEAMRQLDPSIRSSELYFCALAYLNFSTKDIANFTFVTTRAVQVRKNRMRKKHNIPSEIDFNEWFRTIELQNISTEKKVIR